MKALILAAGLGTRLKPITQNIPKALAKINDLTLLEILIIRLKKYNITDVIINVHHFADQVIEFAEKNNHFGINIQFSDERGELLDTGGGIKKVQWFFDDKSPFLVHNVDVISTIDLDELYEYHKRSESMATLAVRDRKTSRYFLFDQQNVLCGWKNVSTGEEIITRETSLINPLAFSGIHIISSEIFELIERSGKFSIVEEYLRLSNNYKISAYNHNNTHWMDLGKVENLEQASKIIDQII